MKKWVNDIYIKAMTFMAHVNWEWLVKNKSYLTENDKRKLKRYLVKNYYIIATFQPYTLSGMFVVFATLILTGKMPRYTHILVNVEPEGAAHDDFRFVEATSSGVHYSDFEKALGKAKRVMLLVPKYYSQEAFDETVGEVYKHVGKPYDFGFDLKSSKSLACVEVVWLRLKQMPFAEDHFRCLNMLVEMEGNLTPEMFMCPDFKKVIEVGK